MNNLYPGFVVKGATNFSYLIFGGSYSSANWTSWPTQTYYLKFGYSTEAEGSWLGFAVGAAGDVTGDGETHRDVLIGDIRYPGHLGPRRRGGEGVADSRHHVHLKPTDHYPHRGRRLPVRALD